jgi:hypothetical protein
LLFPSLSLLAPALPFSSFQLSLYLEQNRTEQNRTNYLLSICPPSPKKPTSRSLWCISCYKGSCISCQVFPLVLVCVLSSEDILLSGG